MTAPITMSARGQARRRAFLDAALQVFLSQGLAAASVNDVVRLAGGSLATLYAQFNSKEGLFVAMFEERVERIVVPLRQIGASGLPLAQGLQEMGERFLAAILTPEAVAIYRIVISEGRKYPEVAARFQTMGLEPVRAAVRAYLEERIAAGEARATIDADWSATYFIELVRARHLYPAMTLTDFELAPAQIASHVSRAVDVFINGVKAS